MHAQAAEQCAISKEQPAAVPPIKLAHVAIRTSRFPEMLSWYKTVLGAKSVFENQELAFLAYDEEHHRIALVSMPGLREQPRGIAGVHHVAFTFASLYVLLTTHERLSGAGIHPVLPINHGPTTSIYYADPDGNQVELQVDNFESNEEATAFFNSSAFAANPVGTDFDPAKLLARLRSGESERTLKQRPEIGTRSPSSVPLR